MNTEAPKYTRPYRARSLQRANERIGALQSQVECLSSLLEQCLKDKLQLAKLASKEPLFYNPLEVMAVEAMRDTLLRNWKLIK